MPREYLVSNSAHKQFMDKAMADLSREKVVFDIGGGEPFQKWLSEYKELFQNTQFKSIDFDPNSGADIVGDIHNLPVPDATLPAIICHSVLEHVEDPLRAMAELYRILEKGGKMFFHVPSIYPYHARKGVYPDYWRFFDDTITLLFKNFTTVSVCKRGGYFKALSFFVPYQHKLRFFLDPVAEWCDRIFRTDKKTTTSGYYVYAIK